MPKTGRLKNRKTQNRDNKIVLFSVSPNDRNPNSPTRLDHFIKNYKQNSLGQCLRIYWDVPILALTCFRMRLGMGHKSNVRNQNQFKFWTSTIIIQMVYVLHFLSVMLQHFDTGTQLMDRSNVKQKEIKIEQISFLVHVLRINMDGLFFNVAISLAWILSIFVLYHIFPLYN